MTTVSAAAKPAVARDRNADRRIIRIWLTTIAMLVLAMVMVGGATRLTESGLSITEWEPIHGVVPPLSVAEWEEEFAKYREIPEYTELNVGMTLSEFKAIYWWEWAHRLLARFIGVAFLLPLIWLWATGRIERRLRPQLVVMFILGGLQGAVGWWMVASGLTERTDVSQYRLATHLILACIIFAYAIWVAHGLRPARPFAQYPPSRTRGFATGLIVLVFAQIFLGGLVAGLNAGWAATDWPTMNGDLIPPGMFAEDGFLAVAENPITAQFFHRGIAYLIAILAVIHAVRQWRREPGSRVAYSSYRVVALVGIQVVLGIATVLSIIPISLALLHQLAAVILLAGVVIHRRSMSPPIPITD